ncbi:MAG: FKBP-type peptidyl-prolyl cis-trans isomerase [Methanoculleus sp.]|jgi:FKBP-type peptidyl-prolyl cis-trans isomerase 2
MRYLHGFLVLVLVLCCAGCTSVIEQVEPGDTVKVHYTGTFANGTVFDSSAGRGPLEFTVGAGEVIPGFDEGVVGMQVEETKTIHIPADQAYGHHREDLVFLVNPDSISGEESLVIGQQVGMTLPGGQVLVGTVTGISPDGITIDANHRLAGEDLTFTVQLMEIG